MTLDPKTEPRIDISLSHYMEQRALEIAAEKASCDVERERVARLMSLRATILEQRVAYHKEATAKRHARGEVYSNSRVAAINALMSSKLELDKSVKSLYMSQPSTDDVLKAHAMTHFAYGLLSSRTLLSACPADILDSARLMQEREEEFAAAWVHEIADAKFHAELRVSRREALKILRSSSQPIYLHTNPSSVELSEADAQTLGKVWSKLDLLAQDLKMQPLSNFIALPTDNEHADVPAMEILVTVEKLLEAIKDSANKATSKRAVTAALENVKAALSTTSEHGGTAYFELDI